MNYCSAIRRELEKQIGETTFCSLEFPWILRFIRVWHAGLYAKMRFIYHRRQIRRLAGHTFDYVYFVHVAQMDISLVRQLREMFPKAQFLLYYWDSIKTADYREYIPIFDKVFSFDRIDCENDRRLNYLPLFYDEAQIPSSCKEKIDYDFAYIASITHERRYQYLVILKKYAKEHNLRLFTYNPVFSKTYIRYFLKYHRLMRGVHWRPISLQKVYDVFNRSKVIIDFPNNFQSGLTMRTFETLGMGKKLLTCNETIKLEACYSQENVCITSPEHLEQIPEDFFKTPFNSNPAIKQYSLETWVKRQFVS